MKNIKIAALSLLAFTQAYAGAESHGGQVVICPGKETVMLDYYQATLPTMAGGAPDLVDVSAMSSDEMLAFLRSRINAEPATQIAQQYDHAMELIGPVNTWFEGSLQTVSDSDPAYTLPAGCSLQQVAIRQDATMYVDPAVFALLSPAQQGILVAHEALYYVASQVNGQDLSVTVRVVLAALLLKNENMTTLAKAVSEMGSQLFWWQPYASGAFTSQNTAVNIQFSYDPLIEGDSFTFLLSMPDGPNNTLFYKGKGVCPASYLSCTLTAPLQGLTDCSIPSFGRNSTNGATQFWLMCPAEGINTLMSAK